MKRLAIIFLSICIFTTVFLFAQSLNDLTTRPEIYFRFQIESRAELREITRIISIDNVIGDTVYAYANTREYERFKTLGKTVEILTPPSMLYKPRMSDSLEKSKGWDSYPTYESYCDMMWQFARDYPAICRVDSVGRSVEGRAILFAVISDNVDREEAEPEVMYTSTMHGDETTGFVLMLRLIDYLLTNYGVDKQVGNLVNNLEIWINPLANPDGTYYNGDSTVYGATRYNANGVDLNRNFPNPVDGEHPDGNTWQPETVAMMELAERHNFVLSANFHGGAEVVNYPWDSWMRRHADDEWFIRLSRQYADTVHAYSPADYMSGFDDGITNGWDWYYVFGSRQDYMTYYRHGREVTLEISDIKLLPASELPAYWEYNRAALLNYLAAALAGIRGEIRTDLDLSGMQIGIADHEMDNSWVIPDNDWGDFYRLCLPGVYQLEFKNGTELMTVADIIVNNESATIVNLLWGDTIPGDINGDGNIDVADLTLLQNYIAGNAAPDDDEFNSADWNRDGMLNQDDLNQMLQFLLNLYP